MSALRRASYRAGTAASAGFERGRVSVAGAGIRLAPALGEPAGFVIDLDRVLAGFPRRAVSIAPGRPGPFARRARGRWPRASFPLPSAARIWVRGKGPRR